MTIAAGSHLGVITYHDRVLILCDRLRRSCVMFRRWIWIPETTLTKDLRSFFFHMTPVRRKDLRDLRSVFFSHDTSLYLSLSRWSHNTHLIEWKKHERIQELRCIGTGLRVCLGPWTSRGSERASYFKTMPKSRIILFLIWYSYSRTAFHSQPLLVSRHRTFVVAGCCHPWLLSF